MHQDSQFIYLLAGYVVFLGGIGLYLLSLALRRRNLQRDEEALRQAAQQIQEEEAHNYSALSQANHSE